MYAGSHGPKNGIDTILDAAKLLDADTLRGKLIIELLGNGQEKKRLMQRVVDEKIELVQFRDAVPKYKIYEKLATAHAFVVNRHDHPINRFGISLNKFFDFLAMARPTILGSRAYNNPFDESGSGVTVTPGDASAMAEAILQVYALKHEVRWAMGKAGRKYVEENNSISVLAAKLEKSLETVVAERNV